MIGYLSGKMIKKLSNPIIIEVGGIGYEMTVSIHTLKQLPSIDCETKVFCHQIIREDAHTLYGFMQELERSVFRALIKVNSVGPKLAITVLSYLSPNELLTAVQRDSVGSLTAVPGIGKKTAERLLMELKDLFNKIIDEFRGTDSAMNSDTDLVTGNISINEAVTALISLGFKQYEVRNAVSTISVADKSSQDIIKQALNLLSR